MVRMVSHRAVLRVSFKTCLWGGGVLALLLLLFWIFLHITILRNVDRYRPDLEAAFLQATGARVSIGQLSAAGVGLLPTVTLKQVVLYSPNGTPGLHLDQVRGTLSLSSLLRGRLDLVSLVIDGPTLALRMDASGQLFLSGIPLPRSSDGDNHFLEWLLQQGRIDITHATLEWQDDQAGGLPLLLQQGSIHLRNRRNFHQISVAFIPPENLGAPVSIEGKISGRRLADMSDWNGYLAVHSRRVDLRVAKRWIAQLAPLNQGHGNLDVKLLWHHSPHWGIEIAGDMQGIDAQFPTAPAPLHFDHIQGTLAFSEITGGVDMSTLGLTVQGTGSFKPVVPLNLHFRAGDEGGAVRVNRLDFGQVGKLLDALPLTAGQRAFWVAQGLQGQVRDLDLFWKGPPRQPTDYGIRADLMGFHLNAQDVLPAINQFSGHLEASPKSGRIEGVGGETSLRLPKVFAQPFPIHGFQVNAGWTWRAGQTEVRVNHLEVVNNDLAGHMEGTLWWGAEGPGNSSLKGVLRHASPSAVWRYLPLMVSKDARDWLQTALVSGTARDVTFELNGNLNAFPFQGDKGGHFRVGARIEDASLKYMPDWPAITHVNGRLSIEGGSLTVMADSGNVLGARILSATAHIPDLTNGDERLDVQGKVSCALKSGLDFMRQSPVSGYLDHALDSFDGAGDGHLDIQVNIPLRHALDARVHGIYTLQGATLFNDSLGTPPISRVTGPLEFTENSVSAPSLTGEVLGGDAAFSLTMPTPDVVHLVATGKADMSTLASVYHEDVLHEVSGLEPWKGDFSFSKKMTVVNVDSQVDFLGDPVSVHVTAPATGGLDLALVGSTTRASIVNRYPGAFLDQLGKTVDWKGHVLLFDTRSKSRLAFTATSSFFHEPLQGNLTGFLAGPVKFELNGGLSADGLEKAGYASLTQILHGSTHWHANGEIHGGRASFQLRSSVTGLSVNAPKPYLKPAGQPWPFVLDGVRDDHSLVLHGVWGKWGGMRMRYVRKADNPQLQPDRGEIRLGGDVPSLPQEGMLLTGSVDTINVTEWQTLLADLQGQDTGKSSGIVWPVNRLLLTLHHMDWMGRSWGDQQVDGARQSDRWILNSRGDHEVGQWSWDPTGIGHLEVHLEHLDVPEGPKDTKNPSPPVVSKVSGAHQHLPSMDIVVDHLALHGKPYGRVRLSGEPDRTGWHVRQWALEDPGGTMEGSGDWIMEGAEAVRLKLALKADDLGKFLAAMNHPGTLSRGHGDMEGSVQWPGGPGDFDLGALQGTFSVDLKDGQFSKVETSSLGRLLGLLSLQSLPRRITLDFNDVFSDGFAFDTLKSDFRLDRGKLSTDDFVMEGPSAKVALSGDVNLLLETASLQARVDPAVGSSLSLATTVIGGPVAGAATYLVQKILHNPLDRALSYEYSIDGAWDNPDITKTGTLSLLPKP